MTTPLALDLVDPARSGSGRPRPLRTTLWRPEPLGHPGPLPVVLLSHGTGGSARSLAWLAEALTAEGWAVLAVDHHGNSDTGGYLAEGFVRTWERPRDLSRALDHVLGAGFDVDPSRVAACGFSLGGYTAAALLGVRLSRRAFEAVVSGRVPVPPVPEYPGLLAEVRERWGHDLDGLLAGCDDDLADDRVRAAVLICPSTGRLLDTGSAGAVRRPVLVLSGGADDIAPVESDAAVYAAGIPGARHVLLGPAVGHYDLLDAATPATRTPVHRRAAHLVVEFLSPVRSAGA
ncbi:hypothetical protein NUM3379_25850 [Kineococcus sp. NUM-3379]